MKKIIKIKRLLPKLTYPNWLFPDFTNQGWHPYFCELFRIVIIYSLEIRADIDISIDTDVFFTDKANALEFKKVIIGKLKNQGISIPTKTFE